MSHCYLLKKKKNFPCYSEMYKLALLKNAKDSLLLPNKGSYRSKTFFGRRIQAWYKVDVGTRVSLWNALHSLNQWPCPALSIWLITPVFPHYVNNFMSSAEHSINLRRNPALHPDRYTLSVLPAARRLWETLFWNPVKTFTTHFTHTGSKRTPAIFKM